MFCGKSTELVRCVLEARKQKTRVRCFKHSLDTRYAADQIVSHSGYRVDALPVSESADILRGVSDLDDMVVIDEAHFFDPSLTDVVVQLAGTGKSVLVAGMDQDYLGRPFGPMGALLAVADVVEKLKAVCAVCGAPASKSFLIAGSENMQGNILVGAGEYYEPRCRDCYMRGQDVRR
jgi:thymidine kinase